MNVVAFPKPATAISCSACGTTVDAGCDCGVAYRPAGARATEAIAANPHKSNRAIADEIGVSEPTVRRARTASHDAVDEPRIGLDGKVRRIPIRSTPEVTEDSPSEVRKAFLFYSYEARLLARYDGPIDAEVLASASQTAAAWQHLVNELKGN